MKHQWQNYSVQSAKDFDLLSKNKNNYSLSIVQRNDLPDE